MHILSVHNTVIRSAEVIEHLQRRVLAEPAITDIVTEIAPDPQLWGSSGLHFAARLRASGAPVLLKVHVPPDQLWWTRQLAQVDSRLQPHVYGTGVLAGEDLGWILWERVSGGLHPGMRGREFDLLLAAGVAFQVAARALAPAAKRAGVLHTLCCDVLAARIEQGVRRGAPGSAARVLERMAADWSWVAGICEAEICHGDLHMANALIRNAPEDDRALVIDAHPTLMPWACEPAKPEILNAEPTRIGCRNLVVKQAELRRQHGLSAPAGPDLARLQAIVLGWWALQMWGVVGPSPDPAWRDPQVWRAENEAYIAAAAVA